MLLNNHSVTCCKHHIGPMCSNVYRGQQVYISASPAITWGNRGSLWAAGIPTAMTLIVSGLTSPTSDQATMYSRLETNLIIIELVPMSHAVGHPWDHSIQYVSGMGYTNATYWLKTLAENYCRLYVCMGTSKTYSVQRVDYVDCNVYFVLLVSLLKWAS